MGNKQLSPQDSPHHDGGDASTNDSNDANEALPTPPPSSFSPHPAPERKGSPKKRAMLPSFDSTSNTKGAASPTVRLSLNLHTPSAKEAASPPPTTSSANTKVNGVMSSPSILRSMTPPSLVLRSTTPIGTPGTGSRLTTPSTSPKSSPASRSTVSSHADGSSVYWDLYEKWYQRKNAKRQSHLSTVGRHGRPCHLCIQSISLSGTIPPDAKLHITVSLVASLSTPPSSTRAHSTNYHTQHQLHIQDIPLPPELTLPPHRAAQETRLSEEEGSIIIPSVTSNNILVITIMLDSINLGSVRYPLSDIKPTVRQTELVLSPTDAAGNGMTTPVSSTAANHRAKSSLVEAAMAVDPPCSLATVWGEMSFYDNRSSGVRFVNELRFINGAGDVKNHGQKLLLVTDQTFSLLETPISTLGKKGWELTTVEGIEPTTESDGTGRISISITDSDKKFLLGFENGWAAKRWAQILKRAANKALYGINLDRNIV